MKCSKCGLDVQSGMYNCPHCGNPLSYYDSNASVAVEKVNVGLVILSVFFPFVGFILFLVFLNKSPKTAKACGLGALITVIVEVVIGVLFFSLIFFSVGKKLENQITVDDDYEITENYSDAVNGEDTQTNVIIGEVSSDWKSYQVSYNGKTITLPTSYNNFSVTTGFKLKDSAGNDTLKNNYYAVVNMYMNDKLALSTEVYNNSGVESKVTDCNVTRISQRKYHITNGAGQFVFPGNLKVGDSITENDLVSLFGQPNDKKTYGTSTTYSYNADTTWTTTNYYKIEVVDGVIEQLTLDNR